MGAFKEFSGFIFIKNFKMFSFDALHHFIVEALEQFLLFQTAEEGHCGFLGSLEVTLVSCVTEHDVLFERVVDDDEVLARVSVIRYTRNAFVDGF